MLFPVDIIIGISRPCAGCWLRSSDWRRRAGRSRRSLRKKATKQDDDRSKMLRLSMMPRTSINASLFAFCGQFFSWRLPAYYQPDSDTAARLAERSAPAFCVGESFCDFLPAFFRGLFFSRVAFGPSDILRLGYGPYQVLRRLLERHALPSQWQRTMHGSFEQRFPVFYRLSAPAQPS